MPLIDKPFWAMGPAPMRRTAQYLEAGRLIFKERVKIMELHYNMYYHYDQKPKYSNPHLGLRDFYFWEIPHIQYKNPHVQIVRFVDNSPLPFVRCWLDDGSDILFDCDSKDRGSILKQITKILGKSDKRLELERTLTEGQAKLAAESPAIFDYNRPRLCMCEVPDQVPCPGVINLPFRMRGKYKYLKKDELEEWESNLEKDYPTAEEMEKSIRYDQVKTTPAVTHIEGLEKMFMRKPKGVIKPLKNPEEIAKEFNAKRLDRPQDISFFDNEEGINDDSKK